MRINKWSANMKVRKDISDLCAKLNRPILSWGISRRRYLNAGKNTDWWKKIYSEMYIENVPLSVSETRRLKIRRIRKTKNFRIINDSSWDTKYLQRICRELADTIGIDWHFIFDFYSPDSNWGGQSNCFNRFECGLDPNMYSYPKLTYVHGYDLRFETKEHHLKFIVAHEMCHASTEGHPENFVLSDGKIDTNATENFAMEKPLKILQKNT